MAEFEAFTGIITFLQPLATSFAICDRAHSTLKTLVPSQEAELNASSVGDVSTTKVLDLLLETAAGIVAFLGAASALLGHLEGSLKRKWGNTSPQFVAWDDFRKSRHAASLGYRLMYELRNFSQHHGLPLSTFGIEGARVGGVGPMVFTCRPSLDRDALLETSFDWRRRRTELEALPALIDVVPLIDEYFDCLRAIVHGTARGFKEELITCNHYLEVLQRTFQPPAGATLVIFHGESASIDTPPSSVTIVPHQQFVWMLRILRRSAPGAPEAST